jgi:hypothetical protein
MLHPSSHPILPKAQASNLAVSTAAGLAA